QCSPAVLECLEVREMGLAAVGVERNGYLSNPLVQQAGLDDHLRGEFHSGTPLIEALEEFFAKSAQATINIVDGRLKPPPHKQRKERIPQPAVDRRHGAPQDSAPAGR